MFSASMAAHSIRGAGRDQIILTTHWRQLLSACRFAAFGAPACATEAGRREFGMILLSPSRGVPAASIGRPIYDSAHELMGF